MSTTESWTSRVWASFLSLVGARAKAPVVASPRAAEPPRFGLRELVLVRGSRGRSSNTFPMMLEAVSASSFFFKTQNTTLAEGEFLTFDALLRGVGSLKLTGKVEWLLQTSVGYTGEVRLVLEGETGATWQRYVDFQSRGTRGATV